MEQVMSWIRTESFKVVPGKEYYGYNLAYDAIALVVFDDDGGGWIDLERVGEVAEITHVWEGEIKPEITPVFA